MNFPSFFRVCRLSKFKNIILFVIKSFVKCRKQWQRNSVELSKSTTKDTHTAIQTAPLTINYPFSYRFEKQLKAKIMQKNATNMHEVQFMAKMFKYFDIQNRGKVTFEQFYRAMEKLGISMDQQVSSCPRDDLIN